MPVIQQHPQAEHNPIVHVKQNQPIEESIFHPVQPKPVHKDEPVIPPHTEHKPELQPVQRPTVPQHVVVPQHQSEQKPQAESKHDFSYAFSPDLVSELTQDLKNTPSSQQISIKIKCESTPPDKILLLIYDAQVNAGLVPEDRMSYYLTNGLFETKLTVQHQREQPAVVQTVGTFKYYLPQVHSEVLFKRMLAAIQSLTEKVYVASSEKLTMEVLDHYYDFIRKDYPELWHLDGISTLQKSNSEYITAIIFKYKESKENIIHKNLEINKVVEEIKHKTQGLTEYEKIYLFQSLISSSVKYVLDENDKHIRTIYGCLVTK